MESPWHLVEPSASPACVHQHPRPVRQPPDDPRSRPQQRAVADPRHRPPLNRAGHQLRARSHLGRLSPQLLGLCVDGLGPAHARGLDGDDGTVLQSPRHLRNRHRRPHRRQWTQPPHPSSTRRRRHHRPRPPVWRLDQQGRRDPLHPPRLLHRQGRPRRQGHPQRKGAGSGLSPAPSMVRLAGARLVRRWNPVPGSRKVASTCWRRYTMEVVSSGGAFVASP